MGKRSKKFQAFRDELLKLCTKHGVYICCTGYDMIQVSNLSKRNELVDLADELLDNTDEED